MLGCITLRSFIGRQLLNRSLTVAAPKALEQITSGCYPVRALRTQEYLYIRNHEPDRWPAGNPETMYHNVDGGPTKFVLLHSFDKYYRMSLGKPPAEDLYLVQEGPDNVRNVAADLKYAETKRRLREKMEELLRAEGDPRLLGNADCFETIGWTGNRKQAFDT